MQNLAVVDWKNSYNAGYKITETGVKKQYSK
jgi:hypothetical protein